MVNLISNSINYGKEKGTTEITFQAENDKCLIRVNDNGLGISEENMPRLFERFYRVDVSRSRVSLFICTFVLITANDTV